MFLKMRASRKGFSQSASVRAAGATREPKSSATMRAKTAMPARTRGYPNCVKSIPARAVAPACSMALQNNVMAAAELRSRFGVRLISRPQCQRTANQADGALVKAQVHQKQVEEEEVDSEAEVDEEGDGEENPEASAQLFSCSHAAGLVQPAALGTPLSAVSSDGSRNSIIGLPRQAFGAAARPSPGRYSGVPEPRQRAGAR